MNPTTDFTKPEANASTGSRRNCVIGRFSRTALILVTMFCASLTSCGTGDDAACLGLRGPYLGQTPPGDVPQLFALGVVADVFREHSSAAFTPDGNEVFWTRQVHTKTENGERSRVVVAMHMKQENGVWIEPELAPFNLGRWTFITCISPDGDRVYFESIRPLEEGGEARREVWIVDRTQDGWGRPRLFDALEKWGMRCAKVQETSSGTIYFQSDLAKPALPNPTWGVGFFCSRFVDGEYQEPELLGSTINTPDHLDYGFHVDPAEDHIILASDRPGGYSSLDLYVSYRQADGSWGEAINLGEKINTHGVDGSDWPYLSPDGRYLFFMTTMRPKVDLDVARYDYEELRESQLSVTNPESKIHWVSASFVDALRPNQAMRSRRGAHSPPPTP